MARVTLGSNRKFRHLVAQLGSRPLARGVLELLWEPSYEVGDPYVGTSDDLESICGWAGERGVLTKALLEAGVPKGAGFIEPYDGKVRDSTQPHYQIHDFFTHCPEYVKRRRAHELERSHAKTCEICHETYYSPMVFSRFCSHRCRQTAWRSKHPSEPVTNSDEAAMRHEMSGNSNEAPTSDDGRDAPLRSVTKRDATPTRAPTRTRTPTRVRTLRTVTAATSAAAPPATPVLLTFPVVGTRGTEWHLHQAHVTRWTTLFPTLDILAEAGHALAWIEADSKRRKTGSGMERFLVSWFNRSTDRGRGGPTLIAGSPRTAGNAAALQAFLTRRGVK